MELDLENSNTTNDDINKLAELLINLSNLSELKLDLTNNKIDASEIGSVMFGLQPDGREQLADKELVRLAFPRRVYTQSHIDYVVEVLEYINTIKDSIKGVRITQQPSALRHFTAEFETVE